MKWYKLLYLIPIVGIIVVDHTDDYDGYKPPSRNKDFEVVTIYNLLLILIVAYVVVGSIK